MPPQPAVASRSEACWRSTDGSGVPGGVPRPHWHGPPRPGDDAQGQPRQFRLQAGFAEHDVRFGSSAAVVVRRDSPPTRAEAEDLIWPAIWAQTASALGEGDWRPSMNWPDVIELLADADAGPGGAG